MPFTTLISVADLSHSLTLKPTLITVDCRFSLADTGLGKKLYLQGHLPNARYAHLDAHLSSPITPTSGRHPLPDFTQLTTQIEQWGITNQSQVVVYDDVSGGFAARLWWLLRTLGYDNVAVLNGGIQAWQAAGHSLETELPHCTPSQFQTQLDDQSWWDINELQQHLTNNDCVLIDARATERFEGLEEPIDSVAGHIPGSVNLPTSENLDQHGLFLNADMIKAHYQALIGEIDAKQVVHSCGSGVFACFGVLAMEYAGLGGSKIYPGSWSEWIRDTKRDVATGKA
ncbi:MAG: sulfurtransferase [Arenicellales bacterium]